MKNLYRLLFILIIALSITAFVPASAYAQAQIGGDSPIVFGQNYTLNTGQTIKNLLIFGGNAVIMQDSTVTGNIAVFGGNLNISGTVQGGITAFGGNITITDTGVVIGTINAIGGNRFISPNARVGQVTTNFGQIQIPTVVFPFGQSVFFNPAISFVGAVFISLIMAALAVVIALFLPAPTTNIARTITGEPIISGGVGILTIIIAPVIFIVLAVTILLLPLALLFFLVFIVTLLFGWIALGLAVGDRMAELFSTRWAIPVSAGIGTLVLTLVGALVLAITGGNFWTLCCIGVPVVLLLNMVTLGGVVSSRYGSQVYSTRTRPLPPVPPSSVPPGSPANIPPAPPTSETGSAQPSAPAAPEPPQPPAVPPAAPPAAPEPPSEGTPQSGAE